MFDEQLQNKEDKPSCKKPIFQVIPSLRQYLLKNGREVKLPISYKDLTRFTYTSPLKDKNGLPTNWETASYDMHEWEWLRENLVKIYAILKTEGDLSFINHLDVARVDFCFFGNSQPFRIRIVNKFNDNYDHYYIKQADANRIYGLELEHLLSPNRITFFTDKHTLIEEHIPGIPGDVFIRDYLPQSTINPIRLAKEFVKFNERCFVHLLGDMRSYNFVVDVTQDIEDFQYRIRAIDFDQQSYEGRKNLYLPQFFKENYALVKLVMQHLNASSIAQYQAEEKSLMAIRLIASRYRLKDLLDLMGKDSISTQEKTKQLREELAAYLHQPAMLDVQSMGQLVKTHLKQMLRKSLKHLPKTNRFGE